MKSGPTTYTFHGANAFLQQLLQNKTRTDFSERVISMIEQKKNKQTFD